MSDDLASTPTAPARLPDLGSRDGHGAGDHDQPFVRHQPYHFTLRQMARLLALRSEVLDARLGVGRFADDV